MRKLVAERNQAEISRLFDDPYNVPNPTKIPAGRLEIDLDPSVRLTSFRLHLAEAEGQAGMSAGGTVRCFYSAKSPVALMEIPGAPIAGFRLQPPASVGVLGYPQAALGGYTESKWYVQEGSDGLRYVGLAMVRRVGNVTRVAVTVASTRDGADPLAVARERVRAALSVSYAKAIEPHRAWWHEFWGRSAVWVPEVPILQHYTLVQYFHGAASRPGAPPMPLQGVWTADSGGLPPWKGDYHNDLNTQMTYVAYLTAGRFEEGRVFLDFLWDLLPEFRRFAREFYGTPGAAVPGVMSLDGKPLAGWVQYALSPTNAGWLAWMFYQHWLYTRDERFLRQRAYPWCSEVAESLLAMLQPDGNGRLKLSLSSSPEIHDNSLRAWLAPNSNYDQACLKATFLALADMARALKREGDSTKWASAAERLGGFLSEPDTGCLMFAAGEQVRETHRHLSHSMAIHPFGLINTDGGETDRRIIEATCKRYDEVGTGAWCGYSFSWMSCLRARVGDAEAAVRNLDIFVKAFILRNGFHANGDQTGMGFSGFTYRPFTLEGNFLAAQALQEMMLQSWSPDPGDSDNATVRIFPAMPWRWHDASFRDLRAEGGYRVSARRENNATTWFEVTATSAGRLRIRDNFGGREPSWSRAGATREGADYVVDLAAGGTIGATLEAPAAAPPPPPGLAQPVEVPTGHIRANHLPLRIGADSNGQTRFVGDIARARVYERALSAEEIAKLASPGGSDKPGEGCIMALDFGGIADGSLANLALADLPGRVVGSVTTVDAGSDVGGSALHLTGEGFVEIPHAVRLNCENGVTLAAWIRPERLPESGARIIDKSPVGAASGYMLDTYPGDSLRLIFRDPHLRYAAKLPLGKWTHVAATVDGATGACVLYMNGRAVAEGG